MFERYTERARRVIFFARYEASQLGSTTIETEHLLLGLLREDHNVTTRFGKDSPSAQEIRQEVLSQVEIRPKISTAIDLPLSDECKLILSHAEREAIELRHRHIGTEHLLLGMLTEVESMAGRLLLKREISPDAVRQAMPRGTGTSTPEPVQRSSVLLSFNKLMSSLAKHDFGEAQQHFSKVWAARNLEEEETARAELELFMESLVEDIRKRDGTDDVLAPLFEGFDWQASLKNLQTGLPDRADGMFRFWFTVLLADLLLDRYEQHGESRNDSHGTSQD